MARDESGPASFLGDDASLVAIASQPESIAATRQVAAAAANLRRLLGASNSLDDRFPLKPVGTILRVLENLEEGSEQTAQLVVDYASIRLRYVFFGFPLLPIDVHDGPRVSDFEPYASPIQNLFRSLDLMLAVSIGNGRSRLRALPLGLFLKPGASQLAKIREASSQIEKAVLNYSRKNSAGLASFDRWVLADVAHLHAVMSAEAEFNKPSAALLQLLATFLQQYPEMVRTAGKALRQASKSIKPILTFLGELQERINDAILKAVDELGAKLEQYDDPDASLTSPAGPIKRHEVDVEVQWFRGLHARPSNVLTRLVHQFRSKITVYNLNESGALERETGVDAKSIMDLLMLGAGMGMRLRIVAEGEDALEACVALKLFFENQFFYEKIVH